MFYVKLRLKCTSIQFLIVSSFIRIVFYVNVDNFYFPRHPKLNNIRDICFVEHNNNKILDTSMFYRYILINHLNNYVNLKDDVKTAIFN